MKALTWQGVSDVRVEDVPDPSIRDATDIIVRITSTGLCGSDLHLYTVLAPFLDAGDVLGHEPMGIVEEVGPGVTALKAGDRVVIPFNVSCGDCWMCGHQLHSQCETTQVHEFGTGASLFGYTKLYGQVPGGQALLTIASCSCQTYSRRRGRVSNTPTCRTADRWSSSDSAPSAIWRPASPSIVVIA
jgi:threonine dehydrogenase-like Zn-dependent dehydrogenase